MARSNSLKAITAKVVIKTLINFSKSYQFNLNEGIIIKIPDSERNKPIKVLEINGKISNKLANESFIRDKVTQFINKLSIYFKTSVKLINLSEINFENRTAEGLRDGFGASSRCIYSSGAILVDDNNVDEFNKFNNTPLNDKEYVLGLYNICLIASPYTSFWLIYLILQILIGKDENKIDKYLKERFSEMKILKSDYKTNRFLKKKSVSLLKKIIKYLKSKFKNNDKKGEYIENTILIAIRDAFSHKDSKFDGKPLDIDFELKNGIEYFREVVRKVIIDKLQIKIT